MDDNIVFLVVIMIWTLSLALLMALIMFLDAVLFKSTKRSFLQEAEKWLFQKFGE